jgi:hypothetical protein
LIAFERTTFARGLENTGGLLQKARNGGIVGRNEGREQLGHELRAAPLIARERDDRMTALSEYGLALAKLEPDLGARALGESIEHAARERNPAVPEAEFRSGHDAVDHPGAVAEYLGLGGEMERQILEISVERIRDHQIGEDRDVALLGGKGDALCDLRPDIDPGRGSSLHVRFWASGRGVGGACTHLGMYLLASFC